MEKNKEIIKRISIYKISIPLRKPFVISLGPIYSADNIIVTIETSSGITGFGECSPFMTINGESQQTCFEVGGYLAKVLKGRAVSDISGNHAVMNQVIYGNSSIKSAFDIAMYDAASQYTEEPLWKYLGGKKNKKLFTDYTISLGTPEEMAAHASGLKKEGFKIIKVKLGGKPEDDIKRMRAIRSAIGNKIALRVDANQGWSVTDAIKVLNGISHLDIQYCEEPIARWDYLNLKTVRKKSKVKVMADESCCDEHDAARLISINACDMFNLKLGKSSGLFRALKIIRLAEQAGILMQIGGFMESKLAMTANAHLGMTSKYIQYYDFDTPMMFTEEPVSGGIAYGKSGEVILPEGNGLGARMDNSLLKELKANRIG